MQEVKYFLRAIGNPAVDPQGTYGIVSAADAETELGYKYLSDGWTIESTSYLGAIRDDKGNEIGYRIFHVLVRGGVEVKQVKAKEPKWVLSF